MSNNHHSPITTASPANASTFNTPLGELDQALIDLATGVNTFTDLKTSTPVTETISSGTLTISSMNVVVQGEGNTHDELDTIPLDAHKIIFLRSFGSNRITITENGNIRGNTPSMLSTNKFVMLISGTQFWHVIGSGYYPSDIENYTGSIAQGPFDTQEALDYISDRDNRKAWVNGCATNVLSNTQITISVGECVDRLGVSRLINGSVKVIDTSTTGQNALDTGTLANDTWYYIWLLKGTSGVCGVASTQSNFDNVTKPTGFSSYGRMLGFAKTNGSAELYQSKMMPGDYTRRLVIYDEDTTVSPFLISDAINVSNGSYDTIDLSEMTPPNSGGEVVCYCSRANAGGILSYRRSANHLIRVASVAAQSWHQTFYLNDLRQIEITSSAAGDEDFTLMLYGYYVDLSSGVVT